MNASNPLTLAARQLFVVPDTAAVRIDCTAGCLWLTLDHDPRDIVLEAGECYEGGEHTPALLYAMEASRLRIASSPARCSRNSTMDTFSRFQAMPLMKAAR